MKPKKTNAVEATQIEPTRHIISPPAVAGSTNGGSKKSCIRLLELIHYQELELVIETNGKEVEKLIAAFDLLRWDDLNLAQTAVQKAIVRADLFFDSDLRTQLSIDRQHRDGKWNLILTLLLDCSAKKSEKNLKRAQQVGSEVLNALHADPKNRTKSLNFSALTTLEENAVREVAEETLRQFGGHVWKKPLAMVIEGKVAAELHTRMAARPSPGLVEKDVPLEGRCRGFVNDHKQRALLFSIEEGNCVEIGFTEAQALKKEIDLEDIAVLNRRGAFCKVQTKQTTDTRGKFLYQFASIKAEDPKRDLLTECGEVIKKSDTTTSATHSNES
jgi:hypothetical protein